MVDEREAAVEICHQMKLLVAEYHRMDDHEEGPAKPVRRDDEKEYYAAWRNLDTRKAWITSEERAVYGMKRTEMQALLGDLALTSDETTQHLNRFTGVRVEAHMAEGSTSRLATNLVLTEQLDIMVDAILVVTGNGRISEDGVDRVSMLATGLREGLTLLQDTTAGSTGLNPASRRTKHWCPRLSTRI